VVRRCLAGLARDLVILRGGQTPGKAMRGLAGCGQVRRGRVRQGLARSLIISNGGQTPGKERLGEVMLGWEGEVWRGKAWSLTVGNSGQRPGEAGSGSG
jgi:hypothetical protein